MSGEFVWEDLFSLEDFVKRMGQLQLEENNNNYCSLAAVPPPTLSQPIPVLTTRRSRAREDRLNLSHPYCAETYRAKIRSRSLLQDPILVVDDPTAPPPPPPLQQFETRARDKHTPNNRQMKFQPMTTVNQKTRPSSNQCSYPTNKPATQQYLQDPSRNFLHSSASSIFSRSDEVPNHSSQVSTSTFPTLPTYQDFINEHVQDFPHNVLYSTPYANGSVQYPPPPYSTSVHKTVQASNCPSSKFPYSSASAHQNVQFSQCAFQNNSESSNVDEHLGFFQFPYYNSTADQNNQFSFNSTSFNATIPSEYCQIPQNNMSTSSRQSLSAQVPNLQSQLNHLSTKSENQDFSCQFNQNSFQVFPNSKTTANDSVQFSFPPFQYGSSLENQYGQVPQYQFQNCSALPNQRSQVPSYQYQNNSVLSNRSTDKEFGHFPFNSLPPNQSGQFQSSQVPYDAMSYSKPGRNGFCQLASNSRPADHQVQYPSQCLYESASASRSDHPFLNNNDSKRKKVRNENSRQIVPVSASTKQRQI